MKKHKNNLFFVFLFVLSIGIVEAHSQYTESNKIKVEKENKQKVEEFSEPGFFYPLSNRNDETNILNVQSIHKYELEKMVDLVECGNSHMDIYKSDIEDFLDIQVDGWSPGNWSKTDAHYWVVEYKDGTSSYRNELKYYSTINSQTSFYIQMEIDAASERIHNIHLHLPYEDNTKKAFIETLMWLGIEEAEARNIFDKMIEAIHELGENERIEYHAYGYRFYLGEQDYIGNGEVNKSYSISISAELLK